MCPCLDLRKAYVLERRPFLFAKSKPNSLGACASLEGRGGDLQPAHRAKLSLEVEWKRGRELRIREAGVRYLASEARGRAVPPRSIARARRCKPPPASIPLAAARKKARAGAQPLPPAGRRKKLRRGTEQEHKRTAGACGTWRRRCKPPPPEFGALMRRRLHRRALKWKSALLRRVKRGVGGCAALLRQCPQ